jgi:hypothetical protein
MLTIHALRAGRQVILPEEEFSLLIENVLEIQSVEVIERTPGEFETEEDRLAYLEAIQELEQGDVTDFQDVKSYWLRGEPADVHVKN